MSSLPLRQSDDSMEFHQCRSRPGIEGETARWGIVPLEVRGRGLEIDVPFVTQYHAFFSTAIPKRSRAIVEILKEKLL